MATAAVKTIKLLDAFPERTHTPETYLNTL